MEEMERKGMTRKRVVRERNGEDGDDDDDEESV